MRIDDLSTGLSDNLNVPYLLKYVLKTIMDRGLKYRLKLSVTAILGAN
jgi:hypothetical protein